MNSTDRSYIQHFPDVQIERVGRRLGAGLQHKVYQYGDAAVLKVPNTIHRMTTTRGEQQRNVDCVNKFFPEIPITTLVHAAQDSDDNYLLEQPFIPGLEHPAREDIERSGLVDQLAAIAEQNRRFIQDCGMSLDFNGWNGTKQWLRQQKPRLTNFAAIDEKLRLLDMDTLRFGETEKKYTPRERITHLAHRNAFRVNQWLMKRIFKVDIGSLKERK